MPEPGYGDGDSVGFWGCLISAVLLFLVLIVIRGCF